MYGAVKKPLSIHLFLPSQGESIESQGRTDVRKYRFYGWESFVVDKTACKGIDLSSHPFGKALRSFLEEVNLSRLRTVGVP